MRNYKPSSPFTVPMYVLNVVDTKVVKGVTKNVYAEPSNDNLFFGSFKTYGGTETQNNNVYSIIDTANIETWYRPDIKSDCRICLAEQTSKVYEVIGEPENINMRNQFLKFKVQRIAGGA